VGEWNDDEWCQFDNFMIECLQLYLDKGLIKSEFVNLKIRQLAAETCHEFIEWCGLVDGIPANEKLKVNVKVYKPDLYMDFIEDNPDFAPKAKMTISRTRFYKWLQAYNLYKYDCEPEEGRDHSSRWIIFRNKQHYEHTPELDF